MKPSLLLFPSRLLALLLVLASATLPARAAPTALANLPLMSIAGGSTVRPNIMLLYDDSGSMAWNHTPDYVDDNTTCRSRATLEGGRRGCRVGDPPYNSPAFNRQYYNPQVRYLPPVKADLSTYPSQDRGATRNWTSVTTDGFGVDKTDMRNGESDSTNLVTGFPDLEWCDRNDRCMRNVSGYTYPNDSYYNASGFTANPYYYTINVAEYCTDDTLKTCVTTDVNAPAPANHPVPALVRWCDSSELKRCQAKYVGNYKYPRFGNPNLAAAWYATITIHDSGADNTVSITKVTASGPSGSQVITNGAVTQAGGANTPAERATMAAALAKSIVDKAGLSRPFTACLQTAATGVKACSDYGFTLAADNIVGVIPLNCGSKTNKSTCAVDSGTGRAGDQLSVDSGSGATALLTISGKSNVTSSNNQRSVIQQISLGSQRLFSSSLTIASNRSAAEVASAIVDKIKTTGSVKAYIGGNSVTPVCRAASSTTVCLVAAASTEGSNVEIGTVNNKGTLVFTTKPAVGDLVPTAVTGFDSGVFVRTDIVETRDSYPKSAGRSDCEGASCTYDEEMTNFANWYAYYKTRNQMMKTSVGHAFQPLDDAYQVAVVGLQTAAAEGTIDRPLPFTGGNRTNWYQALYAMKSEGGTPVRKALHAIGKRFGKRAPYENADNVVQFACQQNFTFVTTDGYWNGPTAVGVQNNDNKQDPSRFCTLAKGCVDTSAQTLPSLADVALYWYNGGANAGKASLRPDLEVGLTTGLVAGTGNKFLHMRTYALGLGVDGIMTYEPNYDTAPAMGGDFYNLINGVRTGCPWTSDGVYRWPNPETGTVDLSTALQSRVDDLWHAAINGGGKYFAASDPQQVITGLSEALNDIRETTGAAAAAATSTPNISQEDRDVFSATFTTVRWTGNLSKRLINLVTGQVDQEVQWSTSWTLGQKVASASDERAIWWHDPATGTRKEFIYSQMNPTEQAWFEDKCGVLTQCASLSAENRGIVNRGDTIVNWLRGQQQYANNAVLRAYTMTNANDTGPDGPQLEILGDIASAKPAYLRGLRKSYAGSDYQAYGEEIDGRTPTVFIAANDGMLHAFDADTGREMWGYVPRITMKKLARQASVGYATDHQFTTDGSPELADVQIDGKWRTVLVAGLNGGGRGYYALDVTDPSTPKPLWELCADPAVCAGDLWQPEMGYSFGNPMFGTIRDADGNQRWVVFLTSGYNNIPGADNVDAGTGKGFLFVVDVKTGALVENGLLSTDSGSVETPSGLAKITAISINPETNPLTTHVYAGDILGRMWNFDFTGASVKRVLMADAGPAQPITTRPDVAMCSTSMDSRGNLDDLRVAFGTGRMLDLTDIADTGVQSMYVLKDTGESIERTALRTDAVLTRRSLVETRVADDDTTRSNEFTMDGERVDSAKQGWYFDFDQNDGERVNLDPKIVAGTLTVATNLPQSSTACTVGGISYAYHVNVCTGEAVASNNIVGGLLSNDAAAVGYIIVRLPSGALKMITTTAKGDTITTEVAPAGSQHARRAGWRRVRD